MSLKIIRECHLLDPMEWIIFNYLRKVVFHPYPSNCESLQNSKHLTTCIYGVAMYLNLESLDREILQIKI